MPSRPRGSRGRNPSLELVVTAVVVALVVALIVVFLFVYHDLPLRVSTA